MRLIFFLFFRLATPTENQLVNHLSFSLSTSDKSEYLFLSYFHQFVKWWVDQNGVHLPLSLGHRKIPCTIWGCPCGVMVKAMICEIVAHELELQSRYYVHFRTNTLGKGMNPLILPAMGWIAPLLFSGNSFGIKLPTKVDMPLNKETLTLYHLKIKTFSKIEPDQHNPVSTW